MEDVRQTEADRLAKRERLHETSVGGLDGATNVSDPNAPPPCPIQLLLREKSWVPTPKPGHDFFVYPPEAILVVDD